MVDTDENAPAADRDGGNRSFAQLLERVRKRDEQAAAELVRMYEPQVRRAARVRLGDPALRQVVDSMDICQSVLGNFFVRTASGEFELDRPQQLVALLVKMVRNKIHDWYRKQTALRRDARRDVPLSAAGIPQLATSDGQLTHRIAEARELLEEVDRRLPDRERRLVAMRGAGHSWAEIAASEGKTPDAVRIRLQRTLDRIAEELGING